MTITEVTSQPTDGERFGHILQVQRAAYRRDGAPSLAARRSDLHKLKAADRPAQRHRGGDQHRLRTSLATRDRDDGARGRRSGIDYLERNLRRFMRPTRRRTALLLRFGTTASNTSRSAWSGSFRLNYPVNLSLMPVVTAIAAGNRVMLKPSKLTPATNAVLASMLSEVFPPEQITIVGGNGSAFSSLPFDHLVFTGSTEVGRAVMKAASENLVPVTLEQAANLRPSSPRDTYGTRPCSTSSSANSSGGQTCIAPDYALVHESEIDALIDSYDRLVKAAYPDGPTSKDYTSIVDDKQYSILTDLIDDARTHGARIIEVGHRLGEAARRPHTLAPTVVLGVTDDMRIAHEEIFGPILPIFPTATSTMPSTTSTHDHDRSTRCRCR